MQKTTYPFIITFGLWAEKVFGITRIPLRRCVKNAFYASSGKFREKPFAEKNIHFSFSPKILRQCCQNCILIVRKNISSICFFWKFFFQHIRTLRAKLLAFCRKLLFSFVKSDFLLSRGKVWGEIFFQVCFKFFPFSAEIFERFGEKIGGCVAKTLF